MLQWTPCSEASKDWQYKSYLRASVHTVLQPAPRAFFQGAFEIPAHRTAFSPEKSGRSFHGKPKFADKSLGYAVETFSWEKKNLLIHGRAEWVRVRDIKPDSRRSSTQEELLPSTHVYQHCCLQHACILPQPRDGAIVSTRNQA